MYQMIEAVGLTKRYGDRLAVDRLSFTVKPGQVTGFLGPNGAGKSTTMRMILGLDRPTDGTVTVNGRPFDQFFTEHKDRNAVTGPLDLCGIRAKMTVTVTVNGGGPMLGDHPWGGYKQSGLGREGGVLGCAEFFETKHILWPLDQPA